MAKPRARLTDANDPLTSTDSVLAGFEQVSKLTSQQSNNTASQEDEEQAEGTISQLEEKTTSREVKKLTSQEVNLSALGQVVLLESQQANKLASQQANKLAIRKCTFQLNEEILKQLDIFHLQLQLDLGKSDAPYKEVIVEEAIAQLLECAAQNRAAIVAQLKERQAQR
jgi:hypothetical protein